MVDYARLKISRELPSAGGGYTDRTHKAFEKLCGSRITEIGTPESNTGIEGGGLVIDYVQEGEGMRRVVFGFNENGMWIEYEGQIISNPL